MKRWLWVAFLTGLVALVAVAVLSAAEPPFPQPNGWRVRDMTGTVDAETIRRLNVRVQKLKEETSVELVALVVPNLNGMPIGEYSLKVLHDWGVGNAEKDNGIVFVWCPPDHIQRIEVGYGLEAFMPDVTAGRILRDIANHVPQEPPGPRLEVMVNSLILHLIDAKRGEAALELTAAVPEKRESIIYQWWFWVIVILTVIIFLWAALVGANGSSRRSGGYYGGGGCGSSSSGSGSGGGGGDGGGGGADSGD